MRRTLTVLTALNILVATCKPAISPVQLPDGIAACEAVFRPWWNALKEEDRKSIRAVYFPDKGEVAFPDSFFRKYEGSNPPVLRDSDLKGEPQEGKDWFWGFSKLKSVDEDTFEISGGYYCGGLCARHCDYRVARRNGNWVIVGASNCVVS